jgi:hypothetical protein
MVDVTTTTPRVTPTASQSVRVPWGDWLEQLLLNETHVVEAAAQGGVALALHALPIGGIISMFIGPTIVKQYVDMALAALEGVVAGHSVTVDGSSAILTTVANLINANEPAFAKWVGGELEPMIAAALGKLGIKV